MARVFISLGSNMGNRLENLQNGLSLIKDNDGIKLLKVSQVYETEPVGYEDQEQFYNAVACLEVNLTPPELIETLMKIEAELGRERLIHWGPRTLDLDILLYDDLVINEEKLIIPHPRMTERAFVLIPLNEIEPELDVPGQGKVKDLLSKLPEHQKSSCILKKIW